MNKLTKKTVGKFGIFAPIALIILVAGILVAAIFGFHSSPEYSDMTTLSVNVNSYYSEKRVEAVDAACKGAFDSANLRVRFQETDVRTSLNSYDVVYCFYADSDVDFSDLKSNVEERLHDAATATGSDETYLYGLETLIRVTVNEKSAVATVAKHFVLRAAIAAGVLLVATFVYVLLRHKSAAAFTAIAIAAGTLLLTVAFTAICRLPVSAMSSNAWFISLLVGALFGTIVAAKMHEAEKNPENAEDLAEDLVVKGTAEKTLLLLSAGIALGTILIGATGTSPVQWFSLIVLLGTVSALYVSAILFPAVYPPILKKLLASRAKKRRYDYVKKGKSSKSSKKEVGAEITAEQTPTNGAEKAE